LDDGRKDAKARRENLNGLNATLHGSVLDERTHRSVTRINFCSWSIPRAGPRRGVIVGESPDASIHRFAAYLILLLVFSSRLRVFALII
jgi:hypothetical protein